MMSSSRRPCKWETSRGATVCLNGGGLFSRISGDQFLIWGWRIPFLLSIVMIAIGLYIRLGILETPARFMVFGKRAR
jgi:hypothetical protein